MCCCHRTLTSPSVYSFLRRNRSKASETYVSRETRESVDVAGENTFRLPRFVRFVKSVLWHTRRTAHPVTLEDASIRFANGFAEAPVAFRRARKSGPAPKKIREWWRRSEAMKRRELNERKKMFTEVSERGREREGKRKRGGGGSALKPPPSL